MKQFSLGKKIKNLRLKKGMTQAELAGETITRNMLSQIENETALPSVGTVLELAEKLETPAEYFFSEINTPEPFHKLLFIEKIRKAYALGDYGKCIHRLDHLGVSDDETEYLYAKSYFARARDFYREGRLSASEECFVKALFHAKKTVYIDAEFSGAVSRYLQTIQTIRKREGLTLDLEESESIREFLSEIMYLNILNGNLPEAISRDFSGPYADHLLLHRKIEEMPSEEQAKNFMKQLRDILENLDEKKYAVLQYYILCDLEALAQKTGDYKCAYECSSARLSLSAKMNT